MIEDNDGIINHRNCLNDEMLDRLKELVKKSDDYIGEHRAYRQILANAPAELDERIRQNACPREKLSSFDVTHLLGSGRYGKILRARYGRDHKFYAIKVQDKEKFSRDHRVARVCFEKKVQYALRSEFTCPAEFAFQDTAHLYIVMPIAECGDLTSVNARRVSESTVKFLVAQLVLGIEYMHACQLAHRDLKPGNILIFGDSYLKISDFGLTKRIHQDRALSYVGTPVYMAPEVITHAGHGKPVDWWALGIMLYELMYGKHPFIHRGFREEQILNAIQYEVLSFPEGKDPEIAINKLIGHLLTKPPADRMAALGNGASEIKLRPWFQDISFMDVFHKRIPLNNEVVSSACFSTPYEFFGFSPMEPSGQFADF